MTGSILVSKEHREDRMLTKHWKKKMVLDWRLSHKTFSKNCMQNVQVSVIIRKCNKTAALMSTYDNCCSQTLQCRPCSKTEFCEPVPSGSVCLRNQPHTPVQQQGLISSQWARKFSSE